jgi:thiol:disulfide interchange protein DsbA
MKQRKIITTAVPLSGCALIGFLLFLIFFGEPATCVYSEEVVLPSYGTGKVKVRLYTDYFCGPCSRLEPKVERLLAELVKRNVITLTFIDTPVHTHTPLYARYFLYIVNHDKSFDYMMSTRAVLFGAAKAKVSDKEKLEEYLKKHNVKFKQFEARPTLLALNSLIQEDKISRTPSCVIIDEGKKALFSGEADIIKALQLLK